VDKPRETKERRDQPDVVVAWFAYLLGEAQHVLNSVAYTRLARRWKHAGKPDLYFNYVYEIGWAFVLSILVMLSATTSYALAFALIASFRYLEIAVWYLKKLFDSTHSRILSAERNLLFLVMDASASVVIVGLWLGAAMRGLQAAPVWSAAISTFTLNGAPQAYEGWQAAVGATLGTIAGLLLVVAGLALVVELVSERFAHGSGEDYAGPARLPRPPQQRRNRS
jgi:hypothetical protein